MELKDGLIVRLEPEETIDIRYQISITAKTCLNVPYQFGAKPVSLTETPKQIDCSGLTFYAYRVNKMYLPQGSQPQHNYTIPTKTPETGDLAFFGHEKSDGRVYHVGIFVGDGLIIEARAFDQEASFETGKVIFRPSDKWENYCNFLGYRRHPLL